MTGLQSSEQFNIRTLREEDLDQVAEFECEIARISFGEDAINDPAFHKKRLRSSVGAPGAFIAETQSGEIAGWASIVERQNASTDDLYGDFKSFYIAAPHRGGRLSFQLLSEIVEHAQRNEWTRVVGRTSAQNDAMKAVYKYFRFEEKHVVYELPLWRPKKAKPNGGDKVMTRRSNDKKPFRRKKGNRRP